MNRIAIQILSIIMTLFLISPNDILSTTFCAMIFNYQFVFKESQAVTSSLLLDRVWNLRNWASLHSSTSGSRELVWRV